MGSGGVATVWGSKNRTEWDVDVALNNLLFEE